MDIYMYIVIFLLIIIAMLLLKVSVVLSENLNVNKGTNHAVYRLLEISKENFREE